MGRSFPCLEASLGCRSSDRLPESMPVSVIEFPWPNGLLESTGNVEQQKQKARNHTGSGPQERNGGYLLSRKLYRHYHRQGSV